MAGIDIFNSNAFGMFNLTSAVNLVPYLPGLIGSFNLFDENQITTRNAAIEINNGELSLIQTSPIGAPLVEDQSEKRDIFYQPTVRIAKGKTIYAEEVQGVRAFGSTSELQQYQDIVAKKSMKLVRSVHLTWENMMLGCVQGVVTDADGSIIVDWSKVLGSSRPAEIDFDLDNAAPESGALRKKIAAVQRGVERALSGMWTTGSYLTGLCGDNFFDDLITHADVNDTVLATEQAATLADPLAWRMFNFGGIQWINYRGTDNSSKVAIDTNKCKFVPREVPGLFDVARSPSEAAPFVNTPGIPLYSMMVFDKDRQMWVRPEVYSYLLHICTRPSALYSARRT